MSPLVSAGSGNFPRFQQERQQRTALEWGLDYLCVPEDVMDIIETLCTQSEEDLMWDFLHVPKPLRGPHTPKVWAQCQDIKR